MIDTIAALVSVVIAGIAVEDAAAKYAGQER